MLDNPSHFNAGEIKQINAGVYHHHEHHNHSQETPNPKDDSTMKELCAHIAPAAMHSSAARVDAPKCHEETREAVQEDMSSWTTGGSTSAAPDAAQDVLWLTGPAGTGKTAIMGTVSDTLEKEGRLAATFYFSSVKGTEETMSKRRFVTTLAYQLAVHPSLKDKVSPLILSAIRENPAIFDMSLKRQLEVLILQPLRSHQTDPELSSRPPLSILVDGIDECGEPSYSDSGRSRQEDQIEVLSVLLQATNDPAFPFRVIIASRPETWIRACFADAPVGKVVEIFLDDKYSPDDDIRLFLQSKFAKICRRCGLDPSTWPSAAAIAKLVEDASGQFIYVATVLRFIDTPGTIPQAQLDIVLKINPENVPSNPFAVLDALYSSILRLSPDPQTTVLWLKGLHLIQKIRGEDGTHASAWIIDRLFESRAGQAQSLLGGLPSLIYKAKEGRNMRWVTFRDKASDFGRLYAFYHKSFLDYLEDHSRCGIAFPSIDDIRVRGWLVGRFAQTLKGGGPEVPVQEETLAFFRGRFLSILGKLDKLDPDRGPWIFDDGAFHRSEPHIWLNIGTHHALFSNGIIERTTYALVHNSCRSYLPCNPGCKRWRRAISKLPKFRWKEPVVGQAWSTLDILWDRFNVRRLG